MTYAQALQGWHDFYVTAGAAAATLVGLLFVGLSLHIKVVTSHPDVRSLARVTLTDFFVVLLIALLVLAPASDAGPISESLVITAVVSVWLVALPAVQGLRMRRPRTIGLRVLIARFGVSTLGFVGVGASGVLMARRDFDNGLAGLLFVVILLLVVAVRNTWDLLVTVADSSDTSPTQQ